MFNYVHLASLPRYYPHRHCVENIGYIADKEMWVDKVFRSFNFSFILHGEGEYRVGGETHHVSAPCVITQWPGVHVTYGPHGMWEELFLIYGAASLPSLEACGFASLTRPIWYSRDSGVIRERLYQLKSQQDIGIGTRGCADRLDRICENLILDTLLDRAPLAAKEEIGRIEQARRRLEKAYHVSPDINAMARECGMSTPTFRRYWAQVVGMPPTAYVQQLRVQEACRLLAESDMAVQAVAYWVGYEDPLYFSRVFKRNTGYPPTAYRRHYEEPIDRPRKGF